MVLVASYHVSCCGHNWQNLCRNVILFDTAPSVEAERQALGRSRRVGMTKWVRLIRLYVANSWNSKYDIEVLAKSLPALAAELNLDVFGEEVGSDEIALGKWVVHEGKLLPLSSPELTRVEPEQLHILSPDELLTQIRLLMQGKAPQLDEKMEKARAKAVKRHRKKAGSSAAEVIQPVPRSGMSTGGDQSSRRNRPLEAPSNASDVSTSSAAQPKKRSRKSTKVDLLDSYHHFTRMVEDLYHAKNDATYGVHDRRLNKFAIDEDALNFDKECHIIIEYLSKRYHD